jgi:hypothetical protein
MRKGAGTFICTSRAGGTTFCDRGSDSTFVTMVAVLPFKWLVF